MRTIHPAVGVLFLLAGQGFGSNSFPAFVPKMRVVPGGGAGPAYSFEVGEFEVSNAEFAAFLNDAEANPGNARGAFLRFDATGDVGLTAGYDNAAFFDVSDTCDNREGGACPVISYTRGAPVGSRYSVARGYEALPVVGVSWLGALKFCNWLTIDQDLSEDARCYTEGPSHEDWFPVTTDKINWLARDLNDDERARLVAQHRGFRLPMDNLGYGSGPISFQENPYNEWYKAAAYDPAAPDDVRIGPGQERVSPDHWIYGMGRDALVNEDSNYRNSADAFEPWITPLGYYDGQNLMGDGRTRTKANHNPWGIHDFCGNVTEWAQDQCLVPGYAAQRGGSFEDASGGLSAANRSSDGVRRSSADTGFRVLRVPGCTIDVRKTKASLSNDGQVEIQCKLVQDGPPPAGWYLSLRVTNVDTGRVRGVTLGPTNPRGSARKRMSLDSGAYLIEVTDVYDAYAYSCMPDPCRDCLAIVIVP